MPEVTDPVCGMSFPEEDAEALGALKVDHKGKRYWFCCPTCQQAFLAAPETFDAH